jgi:hypothetical protein
MAEKDWLRHSASAVGAHDPSPSPILEEEPGRLSLPGHQYHYVQVNKGTIVGFEIGFTPEHSINLHFRLHLPYYSELH